MSLSQDEQQQIKEWVLKSAESDRTVIMKMQNESTESKTARSCIGNYGHGLTFKENIAGYKLYAARHGLGYQALFQVVRRGGMAQSEVDMYRKEGSRTPQNKVSYWGALIEARTGFFGLSEPEYAALISETDRDLGRISDDTKYAQIQNSRPLEALKKCSYGEFIQICEDAWEEAGLLTVPRRSAKRDQAPAPTTSHAAKLATPHPTETWAGDIERREQQAALLERLSAGLELAASQSAQISQLQATHQATLTDLQKLQQQLAASITGKPR